MDDKKQQALNIALSQIEKQFGKGSIMKMSDDGVVQDVDSVSTGSLGLDIALGIGGLPRGRVVEIYGPESSGKTTLALHVAAEIQKAGPAAADAARIITYCQPHGGQGAGHRRPVRATGADFRMPVQYGAG